MKSEVGRVYYLTTRLMFPRDRDEWVKQREVGASTTHGIFFFISGLKVSTDMKAKLARDLECSWKDAHGVWIQLRIETTKRNRKWGNKLSALKLAQG